MPKLKKGRLIVAASWDCADLLYVTGFQAGDPFIYFSVDGTDHMVVTALEHARACDEAKRGVEVIDRRILIPGKKTPKDLISVIKHLTKCHRVDEWQVPEQFPLGIADSLRAAGITVTPSATPFMPRRRVKNSQEVKKIRHALAIAELAMREFETALREAQTGAGGRLSWRGSPLTSEIARGIIDSTIARHGGHPSATIVACGRHAAEPHNAGHGPLVAHQPIVVDIFPRSADTRYYADFTRTFVKGSAPYIVKRAHHAVRLARDRAKSLLKAGAIPDEAHKAAVKTLDAKGFKTGIRNGAHFGFFHGLGHGVGLEIHEAPRICPDSVEPLKAGEVVTVEPGVYYPAWGGVRLEDLVVVRPDGVECLTSYHDTLEIE